MSQNEFSSVFNKLKINALVVDDMELNRDLAKKMLEDFGCTVIEADSGEQAYELYFQKAFDVVFMDLQMPVKTGDQVVSDIKKQSANHALFIALSANLMESETDRFIALGFDDFISKPVTYEKLKECLSKWYDFDGLNNSNSDLLDGDGFLIDYQKLSQNINLMGGDKVFIKFIDKFLQENRAIWELLEAAFYADDREVLLSNIHKLSGISTSMCADGYYELLNAVYQILKQKGEISEEEMKMLHASSYQLEDDFKKLKLSWQRKGF